MKEILCISIGLNVFLTAVIFCILVTFFSTVKEFRSFHDKMLDRLMAKNLTDLRQNDATGDNETIPPKTDREEFLEQQRRLGANPDELAEMKSAHPGDIHE